VSKTIILNTIAYNLLAAALSSLCLPHLLPVFPLQIGMEESIEGRGGEGRGEEGRGGTMWNRTMENE